MSRTATPRSSRGRRPLLRAPARVSDRGGFVVLGALILVVAVMVAAVLIGKLVRYQYPDAYIPATQQHERRYALLGVEVRDGERVARRLARGDSVWVSQLENGDLAVFAHPTSTELVGFAPSSALSPTRP